VPVKTQPACRENKAIYAALFPRPALNSVWKLFSLTLHI